MLVRWSLAAAGAALLVVGAAAPAQAAPPGNDAPSAPGGFETYTAQNGNPREFQAVAELFEATGDPGVEPCLGPFSFARTVWYRIPEAASPQVINVEATGRTLGVVDLAAFVQPPVPPPPPPPPPPPEPPPEGPTPTPTPTPAPAKARKTQLPPPVTNEPNACFGAGAGGSDAVEEPTAGLTLRVPAGRPVLLQVGRRAAPSNPADENALLSLALEPEAALAPPDGDRANLATPMARTGRNSVGLSGAAITDEDPAQPACPSLGTVWRRMIPGATGKRKIQATGGSVTTLTVFSGTRPTGDNVLDCVNRERRGALAMVVPVRRRRTVWIRIGTDRPPEGAVATLQVEDGERARVIDGGSGGFDPTAGGPAGGFPAACLRARVEAAKVTGPRLRGPAGAMNSFTRVPVKLLVQGASICDAEIRLFGPKGREYAAGRAVRLTGREVVRLPRLRTFRKGRYRLKVSGVSLRGQRVEVRTRVTGRLR